MSMVDQCLLDLNPHWDSGCTVSANVWSLRALFGQTAPRGWLQIKDYPVFVTYALIALVFVQSNNGWVSHVLWHGTFLPKRIQQCCIATLDDFYRDGVLTSRIYWGESVDSYLSIFPGWGLVKIGQYWVQLGTLGSLWHKGRSSGLPICPSVWVFLHDFARFCLYWSWLALSETNGFPETNVNFSDHAAD